jgi:unsaturated rhamnogalacturonyl hydrolase
MTIFPEEETLKRKTSNKGTDHRGRTRNGGLAQGFLLWLGICGLLASACRAQTAGPTQNPSSTAATAPSTDERAAAGDSPDDPGPLATDLSPALTRSAVERAARKVAGWQLDHAQSKFNQQWTFAALYGGLLAASTLTGDPRYRNAVS